MVRDYSTVLQEMIVTPEEALEDIEPGMSIFIGTGAAEPRTVVRALMNSSAPNIQDLELIQIISFGDAVLSEGFAAERFRLKTFFSGWVADGAISKGHVDYIPSRYSEIPNLFASDHIDVHVAVIQVSPPNDSGYCSLGTAVDVARQAIDKATVVIGEINEHVPRTFGDTFIPISDFDCFVLSNEPPITFQRWPVDEVFDVVAEKVASVIEDGSCLSYSIGPLFEALPRHLRGKKNLGIHSPFVTDALMDLINSGAVTNRNKKIYQGKSLTSYALGSAELLKWLDGNPMVEFQAINRVFSPMQIGKNPSVVTIIHARKVDLKGRFVLHTGKGNIATGPSEVIDFFNGAEISRGGCTIFALSSRNLEKKSNITCNVDNYPNQFSVHESVDLVITEYGVASLKGRTVRERAQALIEIAHPDDRAALVAAAIKKHILYPDQIYLKDFAHAYPSEIKRTCTFKGGTVINFRPIRPSDEEGMRKLFYRFSDTAVYYRYFTPVTAMPHAKMQEYVNIDYTDTIAIVGLTGRADKERLMAEGRFVKGKKEGYAEVAFVVDETFQNMGIATGMLSMLTNIAKDRGVKGFTADVLSSNRQMLAVFKKLGTCCKITMSDGVYEITVTF